VTDLGRPLVFRVLVIVGALIVGAIALLLRRLRREVALEEADRVLRAEIERCDEEPRR
jgi:hypothetical protein